MLRIRMSELSLEDRDRLRVEVIAALTSSIYPPFSDPYQGDMQTRPISERDRQAAADFMAASHFDDESAMEITASALSDTIADLLTRYRELAAPREPELRRAANLLRNDVPRRARDLQRRLVSYVLDGAQNGFGTPPRQRSWNDASSASPSVPAWEAIASTTVALANALAVLREEPPVVVPAIVAASVPAPVAVQSVAPAVPHPAIPDITDVIAESATALLPIIERAQLLAAPGPLAPQPPKPTYTPTAPLPKSVELPPLPAPMVSGNDHAIFTQLRQQLLGTMEHAGASYGIDVPSGDPAGLVAALRKMDLIDDGDLRLAEGILALCGRVITANRATIDDYRQALMLYLLFNRSRLIHQ